LHFVNCLYQKPIHIKLRVFDYVGIISKYYQLTQTFLTIILYYTSDAFENTSLFLSIVNKNINK